MKKFYILLWLVGMAQFSNAQTRQLDSLALVDLYNSTNGASWTNHTNWLQPLTEINNWYGVTVSGNRVTQLALSDNNVVGTLPASIGNLTALTSLQIRGNQVVGLSGPIPSSIGNLTNLTFLDLARNFLVGPIPVEFANLSQLQYLALDANPFGGTFPPPVLSLTSLTVLSMAGCQLTGSIPAQIGNLTNLASFNVIANQLSGSLPTELGTLSNLYQLYLNNNQFTGPLPASLNNLNLQYAWFDFNSFTGTAPAFTGSTGTLDLRLNNNQFQDLPNLTTHAFSTLSLQNNWFTFEDLQPNAGIPLITYIPQAKVPVPNPNPVVLPGVTYAFIAPIGGTSNVYQWYKNGVAIGGATEATFTISTVFASSQGSYFARATNPMVGGLTIESDPIMLTVTTPPANVQDSTALVAFYNAMNGPGWTNKTNWLTGKVNTWFGVTLDGSGRVFGLSLPNNQVRGTFPQSFMTLAALQTLSLSSNTFGIILPFNLNQLTALTTLLLNNCGQGGLPPLTGLINLTLLNVTSNSLTFEDLEPIASIPGIVYNPQNNFGLGGTANIVPGNPWSATAIAGGSANQYQWYKAAVPVGGATTNSISISAVAVGDAGSYQLRVTSPLVPGITLISAANSLTVVSPGPQAYFTWPNADGIINDTPSDSYGGFWADIDNDGDDDLAIANLQSASTGRSVDMYENNGGTFTRLLSAGMPTTDSPRNISWVDFDNDGDLDFYVGDVGFSLSDAKGAFYRNEGNKTFTRIDLDQLADGGVWADYDNDGLVDLFIVDAGQPTVVYHNQGNGNFALSSVSFSLGSEWTLAFADIDNDRDQDFVQIGKVQNSGFNNLQRNDSAGFYSYQSSSIISTDNLFSARGGSWADIDNDGDMDFFAMNSNTGGTVESAFYINDGSGNFTKVLASARLGADVRGRSSAFGDLDNDGDLDFAVHNGRAGNTGLIVFLNNGSGTFAQISLASQTFIPVTSVTLAQMSLGDANSDGFLDIFSANFNASQPPSLYRNVGNSNNWIKFRLQGTVSNRSGVGARIEIKTGGNKQIREVTTQTGLAAQNSLVQHFGIAGAAQVDSVTIYWPSGTVQRLNNLGTNQTITIEETTTVVEQNSSNFVFSSVTTNSLHVAFTPGSGTSRLVTARRWSAANFQPSDSTTYTLGQQLDSGNFVMYVGDSSHFEATSLQPDTDYYLEFFEVNQVGGFPKYRRPGATTTQKTLPAMVWGSFGIGPGQFANPFDLDVAPDGTLVVADLNNHRIQKFTAGGGFLWQVSDPGNVNGVGTDKFGNIYSASSNGNSPRIKKFDSLGNLMLEFGEYGNGPGQLLNPLDVDVDLAGNIYVINLGTSLGQINKYNSLGEFVRTMPGTYQNPIKIDIDNTGNIIVTDFRGPVMHLLKLDQVGNTLVDISQNRQYGVDVDSLGYMYTSNDASQIIYEYSADGSLLHTYGGSGSGFGQFTNPYGLSSNQNATKLYVADAGNHRIQVIDITKLNQLVTFDSVATIQELSVPYPLNATALGGVPVQFISSNDSIASVSGNQLTFHQPGSVTITAYTLGTHEYKPGMSAQVVALFKQTQFIASTPIPFKLVGEAPFALQATATSGLPLQFTSSDSTVATITNNMVWVWGPGTTTITMNQPGNSMYFPSGEASQELTVYPSEGFRKTLVATTHLGGAQNHGAIISVDNDGSNYQLLHVFDSIQGQRPAGQLIHIGDFLYGTASRGGDFDAGTIYRIKPDGSEFQTLHMFNSANGKEPFGGLMQASDGDLYGATASGGSANFGTIYKISPDGTGFVKLHDFVDEEEGYNPYGKLLQATNGYLYGTTVGGGENSLGTIFWIQTNGTGFELLYSFQETGGTSPFGGLYQAANGKLYGGVYGGGDNGLWTGALFRIELDGTGYTKLYDFGAGDNGRNPFYGGVITQGRDGSLFGTASSGGDFGGGTVFKLSHDSTLVNLRDFVSSPVGSVVIGPDEKLYGLTLYGGGNGLGTLFKLNQNGSALENVLEMTSETGGYPFVTSPTLVYSVRLAQTITFDELPEKVLGDAPFALTATASSGLPVSYTSSNPSVAYIQSDSVFIVAAGSTIITARQPGNSVYYAADSVSHVLTVLDNTIRPNVPSTNLVFTNVFSTQMNVSFSPGDGERHLVAMRAGAPVTWMPVDGTQYVGSLDFASASDPGDGTKIISVDSSTFIAVTGLPPSTVIHVKVFEYNGDDYTKYLVSSTLSGSRTTLALPNVFVTAPANNAVNQNVMLNVTSSNLVGATTYTIELDTVPYFAAPLVRSGARTQSFNGLAYGKLYYARVKTNLSPDYGPVRSFSTAPAEFFSYVTAPANNATGVTLTNLSRSITMNNVIGAVTYTCELNTSSLFNGISQVRTGARTQTFTGLSPGTTYYSRVRTDLSPNNWGPTRQFTTAGASLLTWVSSPANNAVNVSYQPNVTVTDVGASSYTVQLSPVSDFTANVIAQTSPTRTMSFTGLAYNTQYYSRARTELDSAWGPLRSFTTNSPLAYSYMTSPANNAVNVNYVVNISANTVPGATTYFIEANTLPDFSGTFIVRSGARTQNFTLAPNQLYYVRVSTNLLPGQYGVIRSFTTISSLAYSYITSPANGAANVPYVTNVTAYNVPLATSYIIEANTLPDFTGTSIVKMGTVRTYSFTLAYDQLYYVRVQTNLAPGEWGLYRTFTTGSPQSLAYVTSPANGVVGVPTTVNVTSNLVPGATSYIIELNPEELFTGIPIIRTGASRTKNFTGLSENRTYYSRVSTSLTPGVWGPTRSFTTVNPGGRQAGEVWVESTDEDPLVPDEITEVTIFPNPFTDQFDIHVQTTDQQPLEAQLLDMNGRTVFEARDWMTNRLHTVKGEFSPGIYLLELNTEGTRRVVRVVRR